MYKNEKRQEYTSIKKHKLKNTQKQKNKKTQKYKYTNTERMPTRHLGSVQQRPPEEQRQEELEA